MAVFSHIGILFVFLIIFFFSGITGRSKGSSARKCERISPFFGGDVMYHDGHAFYSCEDAYSLYPSDIDYSNCTKHGNWKPKPPRCLRKAHIELPQHGYVCKGKKDIILHKETYAICCDRGYELYSDQYLGKKRANIRNNNGSLEPGIPECVEARKCERVSPFFGGDVTYHDGQAFYSCEDAYSLFPSDIDYSNCTKHGNWKPKPPQCLRKAHVELPHHGHICKGKSDIILHKETYAICCDRGYELYSDQYLEKKRVIIRNNNGSLEPRIPECVEARCDSSDLYMANVQHINGSNILTTFESRTHVLLSCKDGYGYYKYDRQMTTPLKRKCIKGTIQRPPMCEEAMCLFPGYPSSRNTYHRVYQADARFIMDGQYLEPQQQVEVFCHKKEHYELYVNSTETYLDEFISECRYGQFNHTMEEFPTCVERRCSFSISDEVCLWTDDKEHCESKNFTIPSRSSVHMRCRDGYKHSWSEDGTSIEDDKDALIMCNRGVYVENYTCIPELCVVPSVKHAKLISNNASSYYHGEKITFVCNHGFNLHKKERFETICHLGKWKHTIPPECQPDLCSLSLYTGITIWVNSTLLTEDHGKIKTFENGTNLQIECKEGYTMKDIKSGQQVPSTRKLVTCLLGKWTRRYSCYAERCTAPMIIHARLQHTDERVYDHNKTVTFLCDKGYHFYQNISTEVKTLETTCNFGRWSDTIPSACNPDGCKPDMLHGSTYYKDDIIVELGKETLVKHRTTIRMQCKNMFDLFDENNNILRDKGYKPAMACYQGKWQNRHFCKKRCVTFNVTNGRLITDGGNVNVGETIAHGERVFVETNNTKPDSDLAKDLLFDSAIKCHDGEWHNLNGLSSSLAPAITTQIPTTLSTDTTTLSESESENNGSKGVFPDKNQTHNTGNKGEMHVNNYRHGCTLSDDPRYTYKDSDGLEKDPGSFVCSLYL